MEGVQLIFDIPQTHVAAMSSANPLTESPFTLIPGIDPSAPISEQIEQVDQLNTLLLQEIDANFAKFHTVITSKILPDIKRFAIASEPTRGATKVCHKVCEDSKLTFSVLEIILRASIRYPAIKHWGHYHYRRVATLTSYRRSCR